MLPYETSVDAEDSLKRRLSAILALDAVGYSAMVARDEDATVRRLKGHLGAVEQVIALHGGRIVKTTGDGLLAEFASVVDAVSAAHLMQQRLAERNSAEPDGARMLFRVGVHAGDVIVDDDDLLGDGVNIAARLEGIAPPGGVAVSARVRDEVDGRMDVTFHDLGEKSLKNIAKPVRVFALGAAAAPPAPAAPIVLPDKPSVAVLPFVNMSAAAEDDWFADGVSEDIITALAGVPWIFVIARNSSFTYKGLSVDVRKVGRDLGVAYVLEGSVRRAGNRLRVTGQLIDAATGTHIWAERYDGEVADVFDLQDRISGAVVAAIAPEIRGAEIGRAARKRPESLDAYDRYLRGLDAMGTGRLEDAAQWLDAAIETAPGFAKAVALRAWLGTLVQSYGRLVPSDQRAEARQLAERALELDSADPEVAAYAGYTVAFCDDHDRGLRLLDEAIRRCPSFAWAWVSSGFVHAYRGRAAEAVVRAETALRLSPRDPMAFRVNVALGLAHIVAEDWERLLENARQGLALNPRAMVFYRHVAIAQTHLGRPSEAAEAVRLHMDAAPDFRLRPYEATLSFCVESFRRALVDNFRLAGFPD